jgi:hypothetical protein
MYRRRGVTVLSSTGALQRRDDGRLIPGNGSLKRCHTARIGCIRIGTTRQQRIDSSGLSMQRRQHQGRATAFITRIDDGLFVEQRLQFRDVAVFGCPPQLRARLHRRRRCRTSSVGHAMRFGRRVIRGDFCRRVCGWRRVALHFGRRR